MNNIAIINSCDNKSTGKIAKNLHAFAFQKGYKSLFCYGRGEKGSKETGTYKIDTNIEIIVHVVLSRLTGLQGCFSFFATKRLIQKLKQEKIDTVYLVNLHGYYLNLPMFFRYISEKKIKVVYIMADESAYLGKCGGKNECINYIKECRECPRIHSYPKSLFFDTAHYLYMMKKKCYSKCHDIVFVGPEYVINEAKKTSLLCKRSFRIVDEAIDVELFSPKNKCRIIDERGISEDKIVILAVGPKGAEYFLAVANYFKNDTRFVFIHAGLKNKPKIFPSNYISIGYITDQEKLAELYTYSDLLIFPSLQDTMPNTCLEALSCGTPILCFNISGMPYIADEKTAKFVEPRNVKQLIGVVAETRKKNKDISNVCREYALKRYDMNKYNELLLTIGNKKK